MHEMLLFSALKSCHISQSCAAFLVYVENDIDNPNDQLFKALFPFNPVETQYRSVRENQIDRDRLML
jgi:hypothetical protein